MSKYVICPDCEGEGYLGTLGTFTPDEFTEWYDETDEYLSAHEASKEACGFCKGQRVVTEAENASYEEYLSDLAEMNGDY